MNVKQLIAAALLLSVVSAANADQNCTRDCAPAKTRAQVVEELRQAQADGSAAIYGFLGLNNPAATTAQTGPANVPESKEASTEQCKTRAEVRAELKMAQGEINAYRGQRGG